MYILLGYLPFKGGSLHKNIKAYKQYTLWLVLIDYKHKFPFLRVLAMIYKHWILERINCGGPLSPRC